MSCYFVLHSNNVIVVGLAMLACTNLLLLCAVLMSICKTYNTVLCFIKLFCVITLYSYFISYGSVL